VRIIIMKSYSSREIIQILRADGWVEVGCDGDHHQFKHPTKKGKVTVTHPEKDVPIGTVGSISRQSGIKFK
jgi:predicted RNA binding protein YcfA (HicA-like mRNA interferase family)